MLNSSQGANERNKCMPGYGRILRTSSISSNQLQATTNSNANKMQMSCEPLNFNANLICNLQLVTKYLVECEARAHNAN